MNDQLKIPSSLNRLIPCGAAAILLCSCLQAQVITVKQDGTGDFTAIQPAINAAANGDTVLVYPGIYYENIILTNRYLTLASTWIITPADSLVDLTVIDGNHQGSCIRTEDGDDWVTVAGLTLRNGFGTNTEPLSPYRYGIGGGIRCRFSKMKVIRCKVIDNFASHGAGILSYVSEIYLSGNYITNNWSTATGGGFSSVYSRVVFDSINRNNVFLNLSSASNDIWINEHDIIDKIWLDTATTIDPDNYFIARHDNNGMIIDRVPVSVLNGKIQQVNADLYVDDQGSDQNSGLTLQEPLKTIAWALIRIVSDSLDPKTVHLAPGVYSPSLTGERLALQLKNHVKIIGQGHDNTIIDCEDKYSAARLAFGQQYSLVRGVGFHNGNGYFTDRWGGIATGFSGKLVLDSIAVVNTTGYFEVAISSDRDDSLVISNSLFDHCTGYQIVSIGGNKNGVPRQINLLSNRFTSNYPDTSLFRRQLSLFIYNVSNLGDTATVRVVNCLFDNNLDSAGWGPPGVNALYVGYHSQADVLNCTFADNILLNQYSGAVAPSDGSRINFYNSILYGNYPYQAVLFSHNQVSPCTLSFDHSLVQNAIHGIKDYGGENQLIWGEGNLGSDPLFFGSGEHPYSIDYGSPCIDAGTTNLPPGLTLPEFDLAGNPRIWGENVDIGAYEYGPWVSVAEKPGVKPPEAEITSISAAPNPFTHGTYIRFLAQQQGITDISVYNASGLKVRTLFHTACRPGDQAEIYWDGTDTGGTPLPAGSYLIRLSVDGKNRNTMKVVKSG
jgi:hypothetical protein